MEVHRLCCLQLPGVAVLGFGGCSAETSKDHIIHAHQFVGLLKGNMDRRISSKAFRAFLESDAGQKIRENDGGDLLTALQRGAVGSLSMMYTHRLQQSGRGLPSVFLSAAGVQEIMNKLPNANETVKNKLKEIFANYLTQSGPGNVLSFVQLASPEQCTEDGLDEMLTGADDAPSGTPLSGEGGAGNALVPVHVWRELYESTAMQKVLKAQLEAKDTVIAANEMVKVAEIEKERAMVSVRAMEVEKERAMVSVRAMEVEKEKAEKELAQKELSCFKESAAKDLTIVKLQMQLELAETKEKMRAEFEKERPERDGHRDKVQRTTGVKMHARDTVFPRLVSVFWKNGDIGVNSFVRLSIRSNDSGSQEPITVMPRLSVGCEFEAGENFLHRSFGFCFRGAALSEESLQRSKHIKEAYGMEEDGVHYVCVVLFKRFGLRLINVPTMPYALGLLPCTLLAEKITGRDYRLAVYKTGIDSDDPVLANLKHPSLSNKWFWHSAQSSFA